MIGAKLEAEYQLQKQQQSKSHNDNLVTNRDSSASIKYHAKK
jgi:hypothetical protein